MLFLRYQHQQLQPSFSNMDYATYGCVGHARYDRASHEWPALRLRCDLFQPEKIWLPPNHGHPRVRHAVRSKLCPKVASRWSMQWVLQMLGFLGTSFVQ